MEHKNDSQKKPPYSELLEFLDMQARHHEWVMSERKMVTSEHKPQTTKHRSYAATVGRKEACMVCRKGNHPLRDCANLQGTTLEERWEIVKKAALCRNCLKPGHIASKCRKLPMCKRCNKYHHTLLQMEIASKTEGTNKVPKDVTYVASSKGTNEVLLMTCRVEVTAPDSTVTQARALLDCAATTSLITEFLANKLLLPWQSSNHKIKGLAGFNVRPRGTVKFKVGGV